MGDETGPPSDRSDRAGGRRLRRALPELDIASQGNTIEEARQNLVEALELFFETASPSEFQERLHTEIYVTRLEVPQQSGLPRSFFDARQ